MAGGTWTSQNKVRPGVYMRFRSTGSASLTVGDRGTAAICRPLSWGPVGQVMTIEAGANTAPFTGYDVTTPQSRFLREMFKGTNRTPAPKRVLLYRPAAADSAVAAVTVGTLTVTARYPGVRGNDLAVAVTESETNEGRFIVTTIIDGDVADQQVVAAADELTANDWVTFTGAGALTATTGQPLTGGADGMVQASAYTAFLEAIEPHRFDILIYDGEDAAVRDSMIAFVKRLVNDSGRYCQLVASGLTNPDSHYVIDIESGVVLDDGTTLTPREATWWFGGAQAGAPYNKSLTYATYPNAVNVTPLRSDAQIADATAKGQVVLFADDGIVRVEQDVNTLVTYSPETGKPFRKNRVMRLCNTIGNDLWAQFTQNYIGVVDNDEDGRRQFKRAVVGYMLDLQANHGIQNFSADDVTVEPGEEIDAIVVTIGIQPVDSVEKIYLTVIMQA